MDFVDANIFLRYLTKDSPSAAQKCFELFQRVQRKEIQLVTSESVLAEVVYVLSSSRLYNQPRQNIRTLLLPLINLNGLKITNRKLVIRALELYTTTNLDFEDALSVAHMESKRIKTIFSYDQHFDRISDIQRVEP
jgi:uncharacterized protein